MGIFKTLIFSCVLSGLVCGCSSKQDTAETIQVQVLRGPSAIAFAEWIKNPPILDGKKILVKVVDSPEILQANLIKEATELGVLPMINAANLYNKGVSIRLLGCPIWGTLYIIGRKSLKNNHSEKQLLHVFGSGTTPDILARYYIQNIAGFYNLDYSFDTPREILQSLLSQRIQFAVLSEPYLTIALQKDTSLQIIADLNLPTKTVPEFAQTAIVCSDKMDPLKDSLNILINQTCLFAQKHQSEAIKILEEHKIFAPRQLTPESIERCKIHYVTAKDAEKDIKDYLSVIFEYKPQLLGGKLPNQRFYE